MPDLYQSLSHTKWDCKYHIVFIPKYRRKAIYGEIRKGLGIIFHELVRQKECRIVEGHLVADHLHLCIEISPKHSVASVAKAPSPLLGAGEDEADTSIARTSGPGAMRSPRLDTRSRVCESTFESKNPQTSKGRF